MSSTIRMVYTNDMFRLSGSCAFEYFNQIILLWPKIFYLKKNYWMNEHLNIQTEVIECAGILWVFKLSNTTVIIY